MPTHVDCLTWPYDNVRCCGPDLLIATRTAIRLRRRDSSQLAHHPLIAARIDLDQLEATGEADVALVIGSDTGRRPARRSGTARAHNVAPESTRSAPQ
jgi:hypothetical protein